MPAISVAKASNPSRAIYRRHSGKFEGLIRNQFNVLLITVFYLNCCKFDQILIILPEFG